VPGAREGCRTSTGFCFLPRSSPQTRRGSPVFPHHIPIFPIPPPRTPLHGPWAILCTFERPFLSTSSHVLHPVLSIEPPSSLAQRPSFPSPLSFLHVVPSPAFPCRPAPLTILTSLPTEGVTPRPCEGVTETVTTEGLKVFYPTEAVTPTEFVPVSTFGSAGLRHFVPSSLCLKY